MSLYLSLSRKIRTLLLSSGYREGFLNCLKGEGVGEVKVAFLLLLFS